MLERVIKSGHDREQLFALLKSKTKPYTIRIVEGEKRSDPQNRLQFQWCLDAAEQLRDESATDKRAYCKLHFGIPILRAEDDDFRAQYDRTVKGFEYWKKLEIMKEPIDFPVTRLMTKKQKTKYLEAVGQHFREQGVILTDPDLLVAA